MEMINKNDNEMYEYSDNKNNMYYISYYNEIVEEQIILTMNINANGYYFDSNRNIESNMSDVIDLNKTYGIVKFYNKEELNEIVKIKINEIRSKEEKFKKNMFI